MLSRRCRWSCFSIFVLVASFCHGESVWQHTTWHGEVAWSAMQGQQLAIVSEQRERLIYFGGADGESNVLNAPEKKAPTQKVSAPNWGGHRFWLGPQSRWGWPPPADWEFSAATTIEASAAVLLVREPRTNSAYPAIEREYAWEGNRLRSTVRWKAGERPSYGMHVVAIQIPAEFEVHLVPWEHVPKGLVAVKGDSPDIATVLPHPAVTVEHDRAHVRSGIAVGKFGLAPQPLLVHRGTATFIVHPGPFHGTAIESPDFGYLTQLWVGDATSTFCEMEQITPFLLPADDGWCGSTIYFELRSNAPAAK